MSEAERNKLEEVIYWGRAAIGTVLGAVFAVFWRESWGGLLQAVSVALIFYVGTYYLIRTILGDYRVELLGGASKLSMIGVGIFFMAWIFSWIFFYSLFFRPG